MSSTPKAKSKKRAPVAKGRDPLTATRMPPDLITKLDAWASSQRISRSGHPPADQGWAGGERQVGLTCETFIHENGEPGHPVAKGPSIMTKQASRRKELLAQIPDDPPERVKRMMRRITAKISSNVRAPAYRAWQG